jgi:hypothetical protein
MTKLLIALGVTIALLLLWQEMWLHAIIFVVVYAWFMLQWHKSAPVKRLAYHIELRRKSKQGLYEAYRRGL